MRRDAGTAPSFARSAAIDRPFRWFDKSANTNLPTYNRSTKFGPTVASCARFFASRFDPIPTRVDLPTEKPFSGHSWANQDHPSLTLTTAGCERW